MRLIVSTLAILILAAPVAAGDDGLTGYWKFSFFQQGTQTTIWLVHLDKDKDNKLTATAEPFKGAPRAKFEDVKQSGDTISAKITATIFGDRGPETMIFDYEAKLPKPGAKKIYGSLSPRGGSVLPALMEATSAKNLFEVDCEILQKTPSDPRALNGIFDVINRAKDNKADAKDLQGWIESSQKASEMYGPRFQVKHNVRLLYALLGQKTYAEVGAETARKVNKLIDPKMEYDFQASILTVAASLLRVGGQQKDADAIESRLDKEDLRLFADFNNAKEPPLNFKPEKFAGRKGKSKRGVLVELFTGAQCPPCVAADMAFDGLEKSYQPGDAVLLQYHMHIPRPDPMSNADSDTRFEYYAAVNKKVRGTPTGMFNGKTLAGDGGGRDDAPEKYKEYCDIVNKALETPDTLKLSASVVRTGEKLAITAKVQTTEKPGETLRLRLALVEDWVRYKGSNGLQYHHRVVRAFPGGAKGVGFKDKDFEHKATIDLDDLRVSLNKYLNEDYPDGPRPMRMRNLNVVAFVQDDETTEVLQAVNVAVRDEK